MAVATGTALAIGAGVGLLGAAMQSNAAGKAADAQAGAARAGINAQISQYDQTRLDQEPWRRAGGSAINQLSYLLGLPGYGPAATRPNGTLGALGRKPAGTLSMGGATLPTPNQIAAPGTGPKKLGASEAFGVVNQLSETEPGGIFDPSGEAVQTQGGGGAGQTINYTMNPGSGVWEPDTSSYGQLGDFGSLSRDFSMADFEADPGYQFRFDEGQKALERSASARGRLLGGGQLKALTRYGHDMGSLEYGNAFNRFQTNRNTRFNQLAAVAGIGQTANGQLAQVGMNTANNNAQLLGQLGNAQSAGIMGQANAWSGALTNGVNNWTQWQMLRDLK